MSLNFSRNPFIKSGEVKPCNVNNKFSNYDKLGRRTVEEVREDMNSLKFNNKSEPRKTDIPSNDFNHVPNFKNKVDNLRNINRG